MNPSVVNQIFQKAVTYDRGDAKRIQHFIKVHGFSRQIALAENMPEEDRVILEVAAILHDIGIHDSEEKYGDCNGNHQEEMGPPVARRLLQDSGLSAAAIERICFLIAHHHTYQNVVGLDYQILLEADFLVNAYEDELPEEAVRTFGDKVFRTEAGRKMLAELYLE